MCKGCGHATINTDCCPDTGLEKQDETGNRKCQNNISKFIFMVNRIDLIFHEISKIYILPVNRNFSGDRPNLSVNKHPLR